MIKKQHGLPENAVIEDVRKYMPRDPNDSLDDEDRAHTGLAMRTQERLWAKDEDVILQQLNRLLQQSTHDYVIMCSAGKHRSVVVALCLKYVLMMKQNKVNVEFARSRFWGWWDK